MVRRQKTGVEEGGDFIGVSVGKARQGRVVSVGLAIFNNFSGGSDGLHLPGIWHWDDQADEYCLGVCVDQREEGGLQTG